MSSEFGREYFISMNLKCIEFRDRNNQSTKEEGIVSSFERVHQ